MDSNDENRTTDDALRRAVDVGRAAADLGFDWSRPIDATGKVAEEIAELQESIDRGDRAEMLEELGDLYFAVTNVARMLEIDPVVAISNATMKFEERFERVKQLVEEDGLVMSDLDIDALEQYWNRAKAG